MSLHKIKHNQKNNVKYIYSDFKKRIMILINLIGHVDPNKENHLVSEADFNTISNIINSIMSVSKFEDKNQYRDAIVKVSEWINAAFNADFIYNNKDIRPHILYVIKRGFDLLHMFFYRDLRRRQFSTEEEELYQNFLSLIAYFPEPVKEKLGQENVDDMIEELLKSS